MKCHNENGKLHREDGPAVENADGTKRWFINGRYHREDGPAVIYPGGTKCWWVNGRRHRIDGPAIERNGYEEWWINGNQLSVLNIPYTKEEWIIAILKYGGENT